MIFSVFQKKMGFWVFLVHPTVVSVLLSASVERCFFSRMRDFYVERSKFGKKSDNFVENLIKLGPCRTCGTCFFSSSAVREE